MAYLALKYVHILLAIVAVGFNVAYGMILGRAGRAGRAELTFALKTVKAMDDYVANPCYLLLFASGFGMVRWSGIPMRTLWVNAAMTLLVVAIGIGYGLYTPALRRQIAALEAGGPESPEFQKYGRRGQLLGGILALLVLTILYFMVFKPV
jgi:uncharacterized membrane protein